MTKISRIRDILIGIVVFLCALLLMVLGAQAYPVIVVILAATLLIYGGQKIWYYFAMARHMVGGLTSLYVGIIMIDGGLFSLCFSQAPQFYVMLYLCGFHLVSGVIDILRAVEAKKNGAPWRRKLAGGIVSVGIAILCIIFIRSTDIAVFIYAIGLLYGAVMRIVSAFKRTAIVHIQ